MNKSLCGPSRLATVLAARGEIAIATPRRIEANSCARLTASVESEATSRSTASRRSTALFPTDAERPIPAWQRSASFLLGPSGEMIQLRPQWVGSKQLLLLACPSIAS